jgi:hypothetical protein
MQESMPGAGAALIVVLVLVGLTLWIAPVLFGIRLAQRKGYSPHWMWFGLHPIGAWVAFIVIACLEKRIQCSNCGGFVGSNFRICPYCHEALHMFARKAVEPQYFE